MKKLLVMCMACLMFVSSLVFVSEVSVGKAEGATEIGSGKILKFEWTTLNDKTTEKQSAIFNVFDSIWNTQPNGTPFYIRSGDKFVYEIYVPKDQFETMKTVSGEPMTLEDISYGYFDFQRDNGDYKYLGFQDRGLQDSEGKSYDRSSYESPDKNKVTSGFVQRTVDLTPLAPESSEFKTNYSTYAHLNFNKAPKAGSVFTFYIRNMKIIGSDGKVKTDFFTATKIKSFNAEPGLFKGDLGGGQTQQGVYPTDKYGKYPISGGAVWTTKNHDLQITVSDDFIMDMGASIRLSEPSGLRFTARMEKGVFEKLSENYGAGLQLGMDIERGDGKSLDIVAEKWYDSEGYIVFSCVIKNIADYEIKYCGKAYISIDGEKIFGISNDNVRSMSDVANAALNDTEKTWTEEESALLEKYAGRL